MNTPTPPPGARETTCLGETKHKDQWNGTYRHISYEIVKWWTWEYFTWNYYLYLPLRQVPEDLHPRLDLPATVDDKGHVHYDSYYESLVGGLPWHGGITFFEKTGGPDGGAVAIKAGCDYAHSWDRDVGYSYNLEGVAIDVKETIDALHELVPNLYVRCAYCGRWEDAVDGEAPEHCDACIENKLKHEADTAARRRDA